MPRTNKKYSPEFKIQVIETKIKEKLSSYEAARRFNVLKKINGYEYPAHNYILSWERVYLTEGKDGFFIEKRGKGKKKNFDPKIEEDLIAKCQRLEMENEYL